MTGPAANGLATGRTGQMMPSPTSTWALICATMTSPA
jgi:hypothetical protein